MFKINRKIGYALIALHHMSRKKKGQLTSAKEICVSHRIPFAPTSRALQIMNQRGILRGQQGTQGGYQIVKNLSGITLRELTSMIAGPIQLTKCSEDSKISACAKSSTCRIMTSMVLINKKINQLFDSITVDTLIRTKD